MDLGPGSTGTHTSLGETLVCYRNLGRRHMKGTACCCSCGVEDTDEGTISLGQLNKAASKVYNKVHGTLQTYDLAPFLTSF